MKLKLPEEAKRLSIYTGERDRIEGKPLVEAVVQKARELGLAGATVLRGSLGYGANSRVRTSKILMLSEDLPLVVEIIDTEEKIGRILPWLDEVIHEGLVTIETVKVFFYRHKEGEKD